MSFGPLRRIVLASVPGLALTLFGLTALAQSNGIYADFTTSMGDFTCQLDYTNAPKAVANFIGLASGQRAWMDLQTGCVKANSFYEGLVFHRVITNFMVQAGSPKGDGTDGPGYAFVDEFSTALRFSSFGMLAMANSGPDSNGSQFFVTVAPTTWLNDKHTIFGRLVSGSNVVYAISRVETDANDKPLTNVVIQTVSFRRVGTAAEAFDINKQGLPIATNLPLKISNFSTGEVSLTFSNRQFADNRLWSSKDLQNWVQGALGIEIGSAGTNTIYDPKIRTNTFYALAQVQYPSSTFAPISPARRKLTIKVTSPVSYTIVVNFDNSGGGTYTYSGYAGKVTYFEWTQQPYNASLWPIQFYSSSGMYPYPEYLNLHFTSATGGKFTGYSAPTPSQAVAISGTFTLSAPSP